ncbi:flippase [Salinivibrio kushneri]|uniref:flippase n=1 Tax=Salinivibrio kushneri TaxID=1908198 RepID=UPI0022B3E05A|nr:flippase [Salinivibrio kushneri]WBA17152.1 flippase [Salinivibrio kushneri]
MFKGLLSGDSLGKRLIRAGLGSAGIKVINRLLTLVLGVFLARGLGPEGYGIYAYAFALMTLLMVLAEAGVPTLVMREVAAAEAKKEWGLLRGMLRWAMQFVTATSVTIALFGGVTLALVASSLDPVSIYTYGLMLVILPLSALSKTIVHALKGLRHVVAAVALDGLLRPALVMAMIATCFWLWPTLQTPYMAMGAQLFSVFFVVIVALILIAKVRPKDAKSASLIIRREIWVKSALPFVLIGGAGIINNQTDIIMLGWFLGTEEVGRYRVAVQGAMLVGFSLQVAHGVVAPYFSKIYSQGEMARLQLLVTRSSQVVLVTALPVAMVFILAGDLIVTWVFGKEFASAHSALAILAIGQLVNAGFGAVGFLLNMTGHENIVARILWVMAASNIVLNAILIPLFGMIGAAVATAISLIITHLLLYRQVKNKLGIKSTALRSIFRTSA